MKCSTIKEEFIKHNYFMVDINIHVICNLLWRIIGWLVGKDIYNQFM